MAQGWDEGIGGGRKPGPRAASIRETDDGIGSTASTSPQAGWLKQEKEREREERKRDRDRGSGRGSGTWARNGVGLFLGQSSGLHAVQVDKYL